MQIISAIVTVRHTLVKLDLPTALLVMRVKNVG